MGEPTDAFAIHLDIWFDVRCPWCFLGKHRLERAIELFGETHPDALVTVSHRSFELAPDMPERFAGTEAEYLHRYEGVPLEHSRRALPELERLAAAEGLRLHFDDLVEVNTRAAHRVFQLAQTRGLGEEMLERLFVAYFTECLDLASAETLVALAAEVGINQGDARGACTDPGHWDEAVDADRVRAQMLGVRGVPYTLVNAKYAVSGAQTAEMFAEALREVVRRELLGRADGSEE